MGANVLHVWDYIVFCAMLMVSTLIGIKFGCTGTKQKTTKEFFLADHQMGVIPVTMSLMVSFISAITLLGTGAEMYNYGTQYFIIGPCYIIVCFVVAHIMLPVFYKLKLTSLYEYLELRFNKLVRVQGTITFLLEMVLYMGVVLYAPALALNAVAGLSWVNSVIIVAVVCTFYTTIGGMKAVIWTDVFQCTLMFSGMIAVIIVGTVKVGGVSMVWDALERGERVEFLNIDLNPTTRHTVWSLIFGGAVTWMCMYGSNQAQVQRYLCTPSLRKAQIAIWLNGPGLFGLMAVAALSGIVAYAYYEHCDPLTTGQISNGDQIVPYFVMDVMNYPGFPGLFIAAIFSGALSTISSSLNSLSACTLEDLIKPVCLRINYLPLREFPEKHAALSAKILSIIYGVAAFGFAFVASNMGDVLQAFLGIHGMLGGPILGILLLGILFPNANWKGACVGHIFGTTMSLWAGIGSYVYKYPHPKRPFLTDGCVNFTASESSSEPFVYEGLSLYRISYLWQAPFAVLCTVIMGLIVSLITRHFEKKIPEEVDPKLICPIFDRFCCCLPERIRRFFRCGLTYQVQHEDMQAKWKETMNVEQEKKEPLYQKDYQISSL